MMELLRPADDAEHTANGSRCSPVADLPAIGTAVSCHSPPRAFLPKLFAIFTAGMGGDATFMQLIYMHCRLLRFPAMRSNLSFPALLI